MRCVKKCFRGKYSEVGKLLFKLHRYGDKFNRPSVESEEQPGHTVLFGSTSQPGKFAKKQRGVTWIDWNSRITKGDLAKFKALLLALCDVFKRVMPEKFAEHEEIISKLRKEVQEMVTSSFTSAELCEDGMTVPHCNYGNLLGTISLIAIFSTSDNPRSNTFGGGQAFVELKTVLNTPPGTVILAYYDRWVHANLPSTNRCCKKHKKVSERCDRGHREALILFHNENTDICGKDRPPSVKKKGKKGRK